ncbi:methyltransferase domain-containing protein [candidate division KSB1 bacterium]|nr:methyltransferase domain-containing protein [candidate division KSB1 bacterium]
MKSESNNLNSAEEIDLLESLYEFIIPKFREAHDIMVSMLDFKQTEEIRVADLGCGFGELSGRVLGNFPNAVLFGLDKHPGILSRAAEKIKTDPLQFIPYNRDLSDPTWFSELDSLHAVISSFTLDYLNFEKHEQLIHDSFGLIVPQGRWISCEFFRARDQRINRVFHDIEVALIQNALNNGQVTKEQIELLTQSTVLRQDHFVCQVDQKIEWLQQAGFKNIEVPWRFLNIAIISAVRE